MNSIQMMLNGEMVKLDEDRKFRPQEEMTRKEAVVMLAKAIQFRNIHNPILPIDSDEVTYTVAAVNDEIRKVTISWGEKPNPGYGIAITGIEFDQANQIATVMYQRHYPHPDRMYPQVIVTPTATTYVASEYTVEIDEYIQPILPDQPIKRIIPGPSLPDNTEAGEPDQAIH